MRKLLLTFTIIIFCSNAFAHTPQVSTISMLQNKNKKWSVFITAPLYTCQLALNANFNNINSDSLNIYTTQKLISTLIYNNLFINGENKFNPINAKIQIAHETTIYFETEDTSFINEVNFKAFSKLNDHFTLLKIVPFNTKETTLVLNIDNNYTYSVNKKELSIGYFKFSKYLKIITGIGSRYIFIAGSAFLIFYVVYKRKLLSKKIQKNIPKNIDFVREFTFSIITILIFGLIIINVLDNPNIRPYTKIYDDINEHSWLYYFAAFPIMILIHDTYFYWTHRLMHHKRLFNTFHLVHHKSTNPSPWAAYAFHPLEAIVENGIFLVFAFSFPLHKSQIPLFFLFSIIYNIYGHLGWELYPKGFNKSLIGKWINTSVCHNQHHKYFKGNYGLYFLFWDRIMGTLRDDYDIAFDEVKK